MSSSQINRVQATKIAGEKNFDEGIFQNLPKDDKGRVSREEFILALSQFKPGNKDETQAKVPLYVKNGTFQTSQASSNLLADIGGGERIIQMTTVFYKKMFQDKLLDTFVTSHEDPHAERLGTWIIEKMGGEGNLWSDTRPPDSRQIAHAQAWNSKKRDPKVRGRRFKVQDCRVWMRLMFWSSREVGLDQHKPFFHWYVEFIRHFIAVYEVRAPPYAKEDAKWSQSEDNIKHYIDNGYIMKDLM